MKKSLYIILFAGLIFETSSCQEINISIEHSINDCFDLWAEWCYPCMLDEKDPLIFKRSMPDQARQGQACNRFVTCQTPQIK